MDAGGTGSRTRLIYSSALVRGTVIGLFMAYDAQPYMKEFNRFERHEPTPAPIRP